MIDEYSLEDSVVGGDVDEYLVARWQGTGDYQETGLRPLTDWFNRNLLKSVYAAHDRSATATRVESEYETLTGDDDIRKAEVLDDLRADGIDGESLVDDFVSASTLYRHFQDCLAEGKGSTDESPQDGSDWEREKVSYARQTVRTNVEEAVRSLENKSRVANASEADIEVPVFLSCPECSTKVRFEVALERGFVCREHLGEAQGDGAGTDRAEDGPRTGGESSPGSSSGSRRETTRQ